MWIGVLIYADGSVRLPRRWRGGTFPIRAVSARVHKRIVFFRENMSKLSAKPTDLNPLWVVILFRSTEDQEKRLALHLEKQLLQKGYSVFLDRSAETSIQWAAAIADAIRRAQVVVPFLSESAAANETLAFQVEIAHDTAQRHEGRPALIPIRIHWHGDLPDPVGGILDPIEHLLWESEADNPVVAENLLQRMAKAVRRPPARSTVSKGLRLVPRPVSKPRPIRILPEPRKPTSTWPLPLEPVGGAVPLHSSYYLKRPADLEFREAILRYDSVILLKGARQIGKTSLLARGLQTARERGAKVALTDFQKFNAANLSDIGSFYISLAESLADQLELDVLPSDVWDERRSPNANFERFVRREALKNLNAPLVWGLDEVDRLFPRDYGSEVFGLFRSWHNERALAPSGPWGGLSLAVAYATEAHLFIADMNQSPFNVGTRIVLEDFSTQQIEDLNQLYNSPLSAAESEPFRQFVGGHPYLVRRSLHEIASKKTSLASFIGEAGRDDGVFGDHLRRILVLLAKDPNLSEIMRGVLKGEACPTSESFYRLRSSGLIVGNSQFEVAPRCELYASFLKRHLL